MADSNVNPVSSLCGGIGGQVLLLPTESPVLEVSQLALLVKGSKTHSVGVAGES